MCSSASPYRAELFDALQEADRTLTDVDSILNSTGRNEGASSLLPTTTRSLPSSMHYTTSLFHSKPLRPLSAYNIFFQLQRERILQYGNSNHEAMDKIPFTIEDMERVVRERHQNWAGIAPTANVNMTSKRKKSVSSPTFGELARQIGPAWRKLDENTKKLFLSFASKIKGEYQQTIAHSAETETIVSQKSSYSSESSSLSRSYDSSSHTASPKAERVPSPDFESSSSSNGEYDDSASLPSTTVPNRMRPVTGAIFANAGADRHSSTGGGSLTHLQRSTPDSNVPHRMPIMQMQYYIKMRIMRQRAILARYQARCLWQQQYRAMMAKRYDSMMMMPLATPELLTYRHTTPFTDDDEDNDNAWQEDDVSVFDVMHQQEHEEDTYNRNNSFPNHRVSYPSVPNYDAHFRWLPHHNDESQNVNGLTRTHHNDDDDDDDDDDATVFPSRSYASHDASSLVQLDDDDDDTLQGMYLDIAM